MPCQCCFFAKYLAVVDQEVGLEEPEPVDMEKRLPQRQQQQQSTRRFKIIKIATGA